MLATRKMRSYIIWIWDHNSRHSTSSSNWLPPKNQVDTFPRINPEPDINKDGKISEVLKAGQTILVQIAKEPISTKGPRLTSEISVAGRNMVLVPFSDKISVSLKIETTEEKTRLKKLIQSICPKNYGVIVRTAAEGKMVAELDQELRRLITKYENGLSKLEKQVVPSLVLGETDRTISLIRDVYSNDFTNIYINNEDAAADAKEYVGTIDSEKKRWSGITTVKCPSSNISELTNK